MTCGNVQKRSHLVDKRASTARASTVHTLVESVCVDKYDFSVLAAEFYYAGNAVFEFFNHFALGKNLLHESDFRRGGKT